MVLLTDHRWNTHLNDGWKTPSGFTGTWVCKQIQISRSKMDNVIHWINCYPVNNTMSFVKAFPLDSDLKVSICIHHSKMIAMHF